MLGRPSAPEIVQVTNFVGPMYGLSEVISWTCGGVRMGLAAQAGGAEVDVLDQPGELRKALAR